MNLESGILLAGRYRLDEKLGEGGMGVVWAATHEVTRQKVALKLLLPGDGTEAGRFVKRFMREARAASAVKHPNVVVVYDVMELDEQTPMMVMELLRGETLGQRLDRERTLPLGEVARVLLPVVSALAVAHHAGIVHRDIKPDNVFLAETPEGVCVKVLDFGVAKLAPTVADIAVTLTATNSIVGTPYYMAPEQLFGEKDVDGRADIWAVGVIAYECLTGQRPVSGDNVGQIMKLIATHHIVPIDQVVGGLPADVTAIVMGALGSERSERPSLSDIKEVLARYTDVRVPEHPLSFRVSDSARPMARTVESGERSLGTSPTIATDGGVTRGDKPAPVRWPVPVIVGALAAAAVLVVVGIAVRPRAPKPPIAIAATSAPVAIAPPASASAIVSAAPAHAELVASTSTIPITAPPKAKPLTSAASSVTSTPPQLPKKPKLEQGGVVDTVPY